MPNENNPFMPTRPVYRELFAGRTEETDRIQTILEETKAGNPTNLLVVGERGIGKTSLLLQARSIAEGRLSGAKHLNYMTILVSIEKQTTVGRFVWNINKALSRELKDCNDALEHLKGIWGFIQRVQVSGTQIAPEAAATETEILENCTYSIVDTVKLITSQDSAISKLGLTAQKDGLVIMIDEADNASRGLDLGSLIKRLSEKLVAEECNNVLLIVAGLPFIRKVLLESHGSALRLFEELELKPLSTNEVRMVIRRGLKRANNLNTKPVEIESDALSLIVSFSEGYPHYVQQFGYSAYAFDTDQVISIGDVQSAALAPGGALDLLGKRFYVDMYMNKIKKDSYREVLKIMSKKWNMWIHKSEIRSEFHGKGVTLDHALQALAKRNVILRRPGKMGWYRLQWLGFALWIRTFGQRLEDTVANFNGKSAS